MSYCPRYNRRKYYGQGNYDGYYDSYQCYEDDYYDYEDYHKYGKQKKYDGYQKFDKCSCFEEMKKLLKSLVSQHVEITTKSGREYWGYIQCVNGWLVNFLDDGEGRNITFPIPQIAAVFGFGVECACRGCCNCRKPRRKECCCGEDQLGRFIACKQGLVEIVVIGEEKWGELRVRCVTDQLAVFKDEDNGMYIAFPLCCITEVIDQKFGGGYGRNTKKKESTEKDA
ncbi:hypothetical protein SH2C18_18120 [Clostridium sediminicola]|uniref:hypothetical protein n=1 Tax=Clostridium sediminicola TaxID=3114879 RepID=UPI0031F24284